MVGGGEELSSEYSCDNESLLVNGISAGIDWLHCVQLLPHFAVSFGEEKGHLTLSGNTLKKYYNYWDPKEVSNDA